MVWALAQKYKNIVGYKPRVAYELRTFLGTYRPKVNVLIKNECTLQYENVYLEIEPKLVFCP